MISELVLAMLLSVWLGASAPAQDASKTQPPATQETPKPAVKRIRLGGNVAKSQIKHSVPPVYPSEARNKRIQGTVHLHVIISTEGQVQQVDVLSGDGILAKAAVEGVRKWEYKPTLLNGEPVEVDTTVDVTFSFRD